MVDYKCEEKLPDGSPCPYETSKVKNKLQGIRGHYSMKHKKDWPGDAILAGMGESESQEPTPDEEWAAPEPTLKRGDIHPNDPFDALRQILHNNGCDKWREATISLFQNYNSEDYEGLEQIMADQHIPPVKRNMVMKTYRAMMGAPGPEEEEESQPVKGKSKTPLMNPMDVGPEQLMYMSAGDIMKWKMAMGQYQQAMKTYQDGMREITGGMPGAQQGQYPPEIQMVLNEFREMKEREKTHQMFSPLLQRLEAIEKSLQQGGGSGGKTAFQDIYDKAMTFKLLDSLGNSKEVDGLRQEAEQRMEKIRLERDQVAANASQQIEALKTQTIQMQLATMDQNTRAQIASLQAQLANTKDAPSAMKNVLSDYMALQQTIEQLRTGEAPKTADEKKMEMMVGFAGDTLKTFQPTIDLAVKTIAQSSANKQPKANAPQRPPMRNAPQQGMPSQSSQVQEVQANVQEYKCDYCGTPIQYVGNPTSITCPNCGQVFSQDSSEGRSATDVPTEQSQREPTEAEIRAGLIRQSRPALDAIARRQGIDPTAYATNEELIDYLLRMRK